MTWSYNLATLADTEKDRIRLEIGDVVDRSDGLTLADEEISHAISVEADFWGAAARCAEQLATRYLLKADTQLGRLLRVQYTTAAKQYREMAEKLRAKSLGAVLPYVSGRSISEKIDRAQDTDAVQPAFSRTMMRNPRTDSSDPDDDVDGGLV